MEKFEISFAESVRSSKDYLGKSIREYKEKEAEKRQRDKKSALRLQIPCGIALILFTYTLGYFTPR